MGACQTYASLWPPGERATACAVCLAESGGNPAAWNQRGEDSRGLFQINAAAHPQWAALDLFDPATNARVAYQLWQAQGWSPWTTYTSGAYRQYLGQCGGLSPAVDSRLAVLAILVLLALVLD